jgi:hypothetical protein
MLTTESAAPIFLTTIAGRSIEENEANAEFIVRACNVHEELLKAAKNALYKLNTDIVRQDLEQSIEETELREAIVKAEGQS